MTRYSSLSDELRTTPARLHIAVGVIRDADDRILLSQRREGTPGAGLWEFPGGKCEEGERIQAALTRELVEELGIEPRQARPLIRIRHQYPDRHVLLDTWLVTDWEGEPEGLEGQRLAWVPQNELPQWELLPANGPITNAACLPERYLFTPDFCTDEAGFLQALERTLQTGLRLVRLRAPQLDDDRYAALARQCLELCRAAGAQLLLDRDPEMVRQLGADGLHLSAARLARLERRPSGIGWLAASCHSEEELRAAAALGCDFAVLGPVAATASHPQARPLGWTQTRSLLDAANLPVYAIGGLQRRDLAEAFAAGAQGIAAIRSLWAQDVV